ncbi:MAG: 4-phosphopantetheinyl transferase [Flavobacteriaceae bacterium]|nr:MAG: 4-phosphopantetheinyl transferase [Flavobacteriaceae bacterium]
MPLYKTIKPHANTIIFVWNIKDSLAKLSENMPLSDNSIERLKHMRSELHRRGFLSVRHLLKTAGYTDFDLYYTPNGKPHLKDGKNISITHSYEFSAIIISDYEIGIDIEKNRSKITRIASKFTDYKVDFEEQTAEQIEKLTVIWGAKESLYKIYPYGGLTFRNDIKVTPFKLNDAKTTAWIKSTDWDKKYNIQFEKIENFTLVYAHDNFN